MNPVHSSLLVLSVASPFLLAVGHFQGISSSPASFIILLLLTVVELEHQLPGSYLGPLPQTNSRTQVPLQLLKRVLDVRVQVRRSWRMGLLSLCTSRRQLFNLTDRQSSSRGAVRVAHAQLLLGNREQRTAVSGRELPFFDPLLDLLVELEQTNRVRHRSAVFPGPLRDGILRQVKFVHQSLKRTRRFYGIQILALNVLDEGHFEREFVGHLPHNGRDFVEPSALRCAPAALAGDQLKARTDRPQDQRLN